MADKKNEDLIKENEELKGNFDKLKESAEKINGDLELKNEGLLSDIELLNAEIAELREKPVKGEKPAKEQTPKEKGFTTVMDIEKRKKEAVKNAAEDDSKK